MVEAPEELQSTLKIPDDHLQVCKSENIPTEGNAVGRTDDLFNLKGANIPPARLPDGFTARGIVALVFSCVTAFMGIAVISWYDHPSSTKSLGSGRLLIIYYRYGSFEIGKRTPTSA